MYFRIIKISIMTIGIIVKNVVLLPKFWIIIPMIDIPITEPAANIEVMAPCAVETFSRRN